MFERIKKVFKIKEEHKNVQNNSTKEEEVVLPTVSASEK